MIKENQLNIVIGVLVIVLIGGGAYFMTRSTEVNDTHTVAATGGMKSGDAALTDAETPATTDEADVNQTAPSTGAAAGSVKSSGNATAKQDAGFDNLKPIKTMDKEGVKVEVVHAGEGEATAKSGQLVAVHYIGKFTDGKIFDTSLKNGDESEPFVFKLGAGMVIKGWDIGVEGMKLGEARRLTIPADLAYGAAGAGGVIPPNSTLVFDVQLMGMK